MTNDSPWLHPGHSRCSVTHLPFLVKPRPAQMLDRPSSSLDIGRLGRTGWTVLHCSGLYGPIAEMRECRR